MPRIVVSTGFAYTEGRCHLFYDTRENGQYVVAYAYSDDGLHWADSGPLGLPTGSEGSWNHTMMCSCGVLRSSGKWRMWVAGYRKNQQGKLRAQLGYCESADAKSWQFIGEQPVLPNGPEGTFDWGFVRVPCVIRDGDVYRMYYTAGDGKNGWFVGYAESADGQHWTKPKLGVCEYAGSKDNNLVLAPEASRGERRITHPWVFKDGEAYRMYYSVQAGQGYAVGTGTSDDGIHWVKDPRVVVLPRGPKGAFDHWYAALPRVVRDADGYRMWYTGYNGGQHLPEIEEAYALGYASSSDGVHWTKHEGNPVFGVDTVMAPRQRTEDRDVIEVKNPKTLTATEIPAERIGLGQPGNYKPCIVRLPSGELLVVAFRPLDLGDGKSGETPVLFRSDDDGRSWSPGEIRTDVLGREPYLIVLSDGTVLMTGMLGHDARNTLGYFPSYVHRSEDAGRTWTALKIGDEILPPPEERGRYKGNETCTTRNILELVDGSLVMGVSVYGMRRDFIWRSTDRGRTWPEKYASQFAELPDDYPYGAYQEAVLWQARSGKLYAVARRDHRACPIPGRSAPTDALDNYNCMVLYASTDVGRTWAMAGPFGDYGEHYPSILRLQDGRLLLTFTVRSLKPPLGLRAVLGREEDDGFHFDFDHDRLMIDIKTPPGKLSGGGFVPTVQLDDGALVSVYSYRYESAIRAEAVRWRLP